MTGVQTCALPIFVGDYVNIRIAEEDLKGYIEYVYPRKNFLIRPPIANIDLVIFVVSIEQPLINLYYVDKYLSVLAVKNLEVAICFNKIDLVSHEKVEYYKTLYEKAGYNVIVNSNLNFENKSLFKELLKNKTTVIGGPSGVGKTFLINSRACPGSRCSGVSRVPARRPRARARRRQRGGRRSCPPRGIEDRKSVV